MSASALLNAFKQESGFMPDKVIEGLVDRFDSVFKKRIPHADIPAVDYKRLSQLLSRAKNDSHINAEVYFSKLEEALHLNGMDILPNAPLIKLGDPEAVQVRKIMQEYFNPELWVFQEDMADDFKQIPVSLKKVSLSGPDGAHLTVGSIYRNAMAQLPPRVSADIIPFPKREAA